MREWPLAVEGHDSAHYKLAHLAVLGLLTLATVATGGQPVAVVIQRYLPTALDASVSAFTRLFADIVGHFDGLLSKDFPLS